MRSPIRKEKNRKYLSVGDRLKSLRGELSQKDFSEKIGIQFRAYQRYEAGERMPPPQVLSKIAKISYTTVDWILNGKMDAVDEKIWLILMEKWLKEGYEKIGKTKLYEQIDRNSPLLSIMRRIEKIYNKEEKDKIEAIMSLIGLFEMESASIQETLGKMQETIRAIIRVIEGADYSRHTAPIDAAGKLKDK